MSMTEISIVKKFSNHVKNASNKLFMLDENGSWSREDVYKTASVLSDKINKYAHDSKNIGILTSNNITYAIGFFAGLKSNKVIVPLNYHWTKESIKRSVKELDISLLLVDDRNLIRNVEFDVPYIIIKPEKTNETLVCDNRVEEISEPSIMLATSGSTSEPKAVYLTQSQMIERIKEEQNCFMLNEKDVMLISTPLYHALATRMILSSFYTGNTLVIMNGFTPGKWFDLIDAHSVTYTISVPAQLYQLISYIKKNDACTPFKKLKVLVSTSSYLEKSVANEIINLLPNECSFYNLYASSETDFIAILNMRESVYGEDLLGIPVRKKDTFISSDNMLPGDKNIGEIVCKGKTLFEGYFQYGKIDSLSKKNGCYYTGDLGYLDENGYLHYSGRKKEIIISGGVNIYPQDIEKEIKKLDGVLECAAYPIPDNILGETIGVVIATNQDVREIDVRKWCLKTLADYQQPRKISIVEQIPKSEFGKIVRKKLYTQLGD